MVDVEDDIIAAGAEIIWVLEQDQFGAPGPAARCMDFMDGLDSQQGWCVGDEQTQPESGTFDNSPFSVARGFDIIVPRESMVVEYTTNHGTTAGNENVDGAEVLAELQAIVSGL